MRYSATSFLMPVNNIDDVSLSEFSQECEDECERAQARGRQCVWATLELVVNIFLSHCSDPVG